MSSTSSFQGQNIQVFVRCRPLRPHEQRSVVEVLPHSQEIRVLDRHCLSENETKDFAFDHVFGQDSEQLAVYDNVVRPLIDQVLLGFNCTVFAYGQTGTGKTYTMEGLRSNDDFSWESDPSIGLIPRAISHLFKQLEKSGEEYVVKTSFLELYNEDAYDLLSSIDDTTKLKIFDDVTRKGSVIVGGLTDLVVNTKDEIYHILRQGSEKRQKASTLLNACSSRSHTIFCITVQIKDTSIEGDDLVKIGKLNLVDMAGSENIGRSGAQDKRAREAGNINQSLLTLGRVITALVEKRPHIPYRESKLTRLLQDSLGGKTKTSIIATISPAIPDLEDTLSTLDYASRARGIVNRPETNMQLANKKTLSSLSKEIQFLVERHSTELCELEFRVRNEVALEFKREMDKMKKSYAEDFEALKETYKRDLNAVIKSRDDLELVNESLKRQNLVERELAEYRMKLNTELENKFKTHEIEHQSENQQLRDEIKMLKEQLAKANEALNSKAASKIRAKAPVLEESSEYVNMTFDNPDEIAQVSAKKSRKKVVPGITRKDLNQQITCSGRKTRLPPSEPDPELSPIEPVQPIRVTRSRATKRKLNF